MTTVFDGKIRRVGNSLAVIIPKEILDEAGAEEGETIKISILRKSEERKMRKAMERFVGIYRDTTPFERGRRDRVT